MKFGDIKQFKIDTLDSKGRGCGKIDGKKACSHSTIPGETVEATFVGKKKRVLQFDHPKILEASPDRIEPECPHASVCGGCSLQHVKYKRQVEFKKTAVNNAFKLAELNIELDEIIPAKSRFWHRNRMDYSFGWDGTLGLKAAGRWNKVIELETCLMLSHEAVRVLKKVRSWAETVSHKPWDNKKHEGYLRYLIIREGKFTGERMVTLLTSEGKLENEKELIAELSPLCTTFYHGTNHTISDVSTAAELELLHGKPYLDEKLSGITFSIHPNSFFQTNSQMTEVLLEHVRDLLLAGKHSVLLDLYCGTGFFSLSLAENVESVLGIELDPKAIELARLNATNNNIKNAIFKAEPAEKLSWESEKPDTVIIDPPRSGLHPKVLGVLIKKLPERIIYISCNYKALATDLKVLLNHYKLKSCKSFDLFPNTPHVETVVLLERAEEK